MTGVGAFELATASRIVFGDGKASELRRSSPAGARCWSPGSAGHPSPESRRSTTSASTASRPWTTPGGRGRSPPPTSRSSSPSAAARRSIPFWARRPPPSSPTAATRSGSSRSSAKVNPFRSHRCPVSAYRRRRAPDSEVTRNSVLGFATHGVKASLRSPSMLPAVALGRSRAHLRSAAGPDRVHRRRAHQLVEPFVSRRANAFVDAICRDAIPRLIAALPRAFAGDRTARADMAYASLCGGLALANAGLGAAHGFAGPMAAASPPRTVASARCCCRTSWR